MDKMELVTTFPRTLRYKCDIQSCRGCCALFEEIGIQEKEVKALEELGYADFWDREDEMPVLKSPCPFSRGKLCGIHLTHGYAAKPGACKKYPFTVRVLDNGWVVADVKWACPGVGLDRGAPLTQGYVEKEVLASLDPEELPRIHVEGQVPLRDGSGSRVPLPGVKELYDHASVSILFSKVKLEERISRLTSLMTQFSRVWPHSRGDDISEVVKTLEPGPFEVEAALGEEGADYYGLINVLLSFEVSPVAAARKLGLDPGLGSPSDREFSREAEKLYSLYLSQCLKETLPKPWSLRASFFWALGVIGYVDFVSRAMGDMRAAIAVVDFLNKGYEGFRDYAYPLYPELGLAYLGHLLGR